jgi:ABC-2 type transport system permease protein
MERVDRLFVVANREIRKVVRDRTLLLVAAGFFAVVAGIGGVATGAPGGYVSLTLDLLAPVEVLVPTVAFAFVYQSVRGDDARGELDVLRTYPVTRVEYVLGVFVGRTVAVLPVVLLSLGVAGALVATGATAPVSFFASHAAGDTPVVYARFALFTALYALVALALALAVSAATRSARQALGAAVAALLALAVLLDLAVLSLVSGGVVGPDALGWVVGLSPASAYRGLVYEFAVVPALASRPSVATASPAVSALSLFLWGTAGLALTTAAVWRPVRR